MRVGEREIDLERPETWADLPGAKPWAEAAQDPGFSAYLKELKFRYAQAGSPPVLSPGSLVSFLQAAHALWRGEKAELATVQPSLRPLLSPLPMTSMVKAAAEDLARLKYRDEATAKSYAEELAQAVEEELKEVRVQYLASDGQAYPSQEELIRTLLLRAHARLQARKEFYGRYRA